MGSHQPSAMPAVLPQSVTPALHPIEAAPVEPWIGLQVPYGQPLDAKYDFLDRALTQTDVTSPNGLFCLEPNRVYCESGCSCVPMNAKYIAESMGLQLTRADD